MIHTLLERLAERLPLYPPAVVLVTATVIVALTLWVDGRSRATMLSSLAIGFVGLGLSMGLFGLDHAADPTYWGDLEDLAERLIGPAGFRRWEQITTLGLVFAGCLFAVVFNLTTREQPAERTRRLLEQDREQTAALGSAHLCSQKTFRRWSRPDPWGWTLRGRFWGANGQALGERLSLSGEDIARGVAVFGPQGSGKTQGVVLPAIADRMRDGHSLIVTDVQGELQPYIQKLAAVTGHLVVVHNPSEPHASCRINLCDWVAGVADAQAVASVLLSADRQHGGDSFWRRAATNLLAACTLHYPSFGTVLDARHDLAQMAADLKSSTAPGAADLAADFANSMATKDPRLALNIMATAFEGGLAPWADPALRTVTDHTDVDLASQLTQTRTVLVLRCARRHTAAYGPYLGTILRVLVSRLDDLGEQAGGQLPIPVGLILEEFPALGRLDSLVRDVNLVRKRRISILTAAQSLAQFDHLYDAPGETDQLLAGLATKIVFGGCDARTATYFSELSGQQTVALTSVARSRRPGQSMQSGSTASLHGRALLLADDLIRPARGHATVFAAYGERGRAEQAIFHAELTPFHGRKDWRLDGVRPVAPMTVPRPPARKRAQPGPHPDKQSDERQVSPEPEPKPEGLDRDLALTEALTQIEVGE